MSTTSITIKTDTKLKEKAKQTAQGMGTDLTYVINRYLEQFIKTKSVMLSNENEIPNERTRNALEQGERDLKNGNYTAFNSPQEAHDYIAKLIKDAKRK